MNAPRRCCRPACPHYAAATLTFVYSDSTAVVGPLATVADPHSWDLCVGHAGRITAPRGWELVRYSGPMPAYPDEEDLVALADAVREGRDRATNGTNGAPVDAFHPRVSVPSGGLPAPTAHRSGRRRGHLRVLPDPAD